MATAILNSFVDHMMSSLNSAFDRQIKQENCMFFETKMTEFKNKGIDNKIMQRKNWKELQAAVDQYKLTGINSGECYSKIHAIEMTAWWF